LQRVAPILFLLAVLGCSPSAAPQFGDVPEPDTGATPDVAEPMDVPQVADTTSDGSADATDTSAVDTGLPTDTTPDVIDQDIGVDTGQEPDVDPIDYIECGPGTCGNGVLEAGETCDPAITGGVGICVSGCADGIACTRDTLLGSRITCDALCAFEPVVTCIPNDGCCAPGCTVGNDPDCSPTCGNGVVEAPEVCDGDCPAACNDGNPCTVDFLVGDAAHCSAECAYVPKVGCWNAESGCCGGVCLAATEATCPKAVCGNGVVEPGETCDGDCPTSCGGTGCAATALAGAEPLCSSRCAPVAECGAEDGCCPAGCARGLDPECTNVPCACSQCEEPPVVCEWNALQRLVPQNLQCAGIGDKPYCAFSLWKDDCAWACEGGACVDGPCLSPTTGEPRMDFCGDALDEDCSGEPQSCATPIQPAVPARATLAVLDGCKVAPEFIDLWQLAAEFEGRPMSTVVDVSNLGAPTARVWAFDEAFADLAAGDTAGIETYVAWGVPAELSVQVPGCPLRTVPVAYQKPAEPALVLSGTVRATDGELWPVRVRVQTVPLPTGAKLPKSSVSPATLRYCTTLTSCIGYAHVVLEWGTPGTPDAGTVTLDPSSPAAPVVSWSVAGPLLHILVTGDGDVETGSLKGPPSFLTGSLPGPPPKIRNGQWALRAE
jgi:hypothetical protein